MNFSNATRVFETTSRGIVGIATEQGWQGRSNFGENRPTFFGHDIWIILQENWNCLHRWSEELLKFGTWNEYLTGGFCEYCGKYDLGCAVDVRGNLEWEIQEGKLAPDPERKRHSHVPFKPSITDKTFKKAGIFFDWIYIIKPQDYMLYIFKSVRKEGNIVVQKGERKWNQPVYRCFPIGMFSLLGNEPDWESIENKGAHAARYYYKKHNKTVTVTPK